MQHCSKSDGLRMICYFSDSCCIEALGWIGVRAITNLAFWGENVAMIETTGRSLHCAAALKIFTHECLIRLEFACRHRIITSY
jgi:hypothetical protein